MKNRIVWRVTRRYMKQNKKRTFTAFLGILFMVVLMTCVFVGKDTAIAYLRQVASQKDGKWQVSMYGITQKELSKVQSLPYVAETAVSMDLGYTSLAESKNPLRPYLFVKAYTALCFDWMNIHLKEGRLPEHEGELLISESILDDGADLGIGDTIDADFFQRTITGLSSGGSKTIFPFYGIEVTPGETVSVPQNFPYYGKNDSFRENQTPSGKSASYQIVGIMEAPSFETKDGAGYPALTLLSDTAVSSLSTFNLSLTMDLSRLPSQYSQELRSIASDCEIDFNNYLLIFSGDSSDSTLNLVVIFLQVFFALIIMGASVLLICNVFRLSYLERSRYLGMLASVGATRRQKRSSVYYEAFSLLLAALPLGIFLGIGVVELGMLLLNPFLGKILMLSDYLAEGAISLAISPGAIALILLLSSATVLISAFLPARRIAKTGPIECIRQDTDLRRQPARTSFFLIRRLKVEGMLAVNTLRRQKKSSRAMVSAASVFMTLMVVTSFGASSLLRIAHTKLDSSGAAVGTDLKSWDYLAVGDNSEEIHALTDELQSSKETDTLRLWYTGTFLGLVDGNVYSQEFWDAYHDIFNLYYRRTLSEEEFASLAMTSEKVINLLAVDSETLDALAKDAGADPDLLHNAESPSALIVNEGELSTDTVRVWQMTPEHYRFYHIEPMTSLKTGKKLDLRLTSGTTEETANLEVTAAGFLTKQQISQYAGLSSDYLWLIIGPETCQKILDITKNEEGISPGISANLYIRLKSNASGLSRRLDDLSSDSASGSDSMIVLPVYLTQDFSGALYTIIQVLLICFVVLTSVICLLNLYNSISGRMTERKREFAILLSVGMTKKQLKKMLLAESWGILLQSLLLTAIASAFCIFLIRECLTRIFGNIVLPLPLPAFSASFLITLLAVFLITRYSFFRQNYSNLLEELRRESV